MEKLIEKKAVININSSNFEPGWRKNLDNILSLPYIKNLNKFLNHEKKQKQVIYPSAQDVFNTFNLTPFDNTKVVILGQDPYHGVGQAHGLAFSVPDTIKVPPSLVNIYKELADDLKQFVIPSHGNLTKWAEQGVLLLNTVLTVRAHEAFSHRNQGWENFTDDVIRVLSAHKDNLVFILWGSPAKAKAKLIDSKKHLILTASHPSPLSAYRGFFGCKHFSQVNQYLKAHNIQPIDWQL